MVKQACGTMPSSWAESWIELERVVYHCKSKTGCLAEILRSGNLSIVQFGRVQCCLPGYHTKNALVPRYRMCLRTFFEGRRSSTHKSVVNNKCDCFSTGRKRSCDVETIGWRTRSLSVNRSSHVWHRWPQFFFRISHDLTFRHRATDE